MMGSLNMKTSIFAPLQSSPAQVRWVLQSLKSDLVKLSKRTMGDPHGKSMMGDQ